MGVDRRHSATGPGNKSSYSAKEGRAGKSYTPDGCRSIHRIEHSLQCARVGRSTDPVGGTLLLDWDTNLAPICAADVEEFHRLASPQGHDRSHSEGYGRAVRVAFGRDQSQE